METQKAKKNKNKTSEGFGGTMSGYGFTPQIMAVNLCGPSAETLDASTPHAKLSTAKEFSSSAHLHLTTNTLPLSNASYIVEPVVCKVAGTSGTIHYYHRNGQYSITAMTTSTGAVAERYAYTAYGQPKICNASGSPIGNQQSQIANRYTYTGRERDETLGLHHFRARWMSSLAGRFLRRDPIGYIDGRFLGNAEKMFQFLKSTFKIPEFVVAIEFASKTIHCDEQCKCGISAQAVESEYKVSTQLKASWDKIFVLGVLPPGTWINRSINFHLNTSIESKFGGCANHNDKNGCFKASVEAEIELCGGAPDVLQGCITLPADCNVGYTLAVPNSPQKSGNGCDWEITGKGCVGWLCREYGIFQGSLF